MLLLTIGIGFPDVPMQEGGLMARIDGEKVVLSWSYIAGGPGIVPFRRAPKSRILAGRLDVDPIDSGLEAKIVLPHFYAASQA